MVKLGLAFMTMVLLVSCSTKEQDLLMKVHQEKQNYYKYLQKTEKVQFKESNITKTVVTATYMNEPTTDIDDESDEVFLIGIYSEELEVESLTSEEFNLTLREVKTKKELEEEEDKERKAKRLMFDALGTTDVNGSVFVKKKKKAVYLSPIDIKSVEKDSPLLKGISFVSEWSQFYLVRYPHVAGNRLTLQVKSKKSEEKVALDIIKAKAKAKVKLAKEKLAKKKLANKKTKKSTTKKKKKIKVPLYHSQILSFGKVAKYAL